MQDIDWNDLRYVLALTRTKSFSAAARTLKVDPTTVARRLRTIEAALGSRLFDRSPGGALLPTAAGEIAARRAESLEAEIGDLAAAIAGADTEARGLVRVTAVPLLVNRVLVPAAGELLRRHPDLRIELIAEARDLSLTRREADIALRLARPAEDAGARVVARRIGTLTYGAYASAQADENAPWLTYEESMAQLPQARWLARAAQADGLSPLAVNDAETLLAAVRAGLGRSLLPCIVADAIDGITRLAVAGDPPPGRELWLLTHPDLRPLARVATVLSWIAATLLDAGGATRDL